MKLEEVLPHLRDGKKIRKSGWQKGHYMYLNNHDKIVWDDGASMSLDSSDVVESNWELYEEPTSEVHITENDTGKKVRLRDGTLTIIESFLTKDHSRRVETPRKYHHLNGRVLKAKETDQDIMEILD